jgi:hypothetical protein
MDRTGVSHTENGNRVPSVRALDERRPLQSRAVFQHLRARACRNCTSRFPPEPRLPGSGDLINESPEGKSLFSVLRQLRDGFRSRPGGFPALSHIS